MKKLSLLLTLILTIPALSLAGVNIKNGNFYISYTDIIAPGGGKDLKITRTYNSKSTHLGWFGFGWGSDFETRLVVSADGSVTIHENGSGARTRFTPKKAVNAKVAAKKIVDKMRKKTSLSGRAAKKYVEKLANNAELRQEYAEKFGVSSNISKGTVLYSNTRGHQTLHKLSNGYKRVYTDGKEEFFNNEGKLTKIKDKSGYSVTLHYGNKGSSLDHIKDSLGKQLFFKWHSNGLVKHIWSTNSKKRASYKYDDNKDLVKSTDVAGNVYKYKLDRDHNMTQILYADGSTMKVAYNNKTKLVESVTGRNKGVTKYKHGANPKKPELHYWTEVSRFSPDKGSTPRVSKFEYFIKTKKDGTRYTHRIVSNINGVETDTTYSECCNLPTRIKRGKHVTTFDFNKKGFLKDKRSSNGEFVKLKYHDKFDKVSRVENNKGWTDFEYDKNKLLSMAKNSDSQSIFLIRDLKKRISKIIYKDKKTKTKSVLTFKYNSQDKPTEIAMKGVGKINVDYNNYGDVKKVASTSGKKVADKVTRTFLSLLAIVKPAGVNLSI